MATQTNSSNNSGANTGNGTGAKSGGKQSRVASVGKTLSDNPVGVMLGGFAVGAVVGAVIPATRRERAALQPLGLKVSEAARGAAKQAAETGRDKLNRLTGEVVTQVGSKVVDAVSGSGD